MADAKPMRTARPVTLNTLVANTTAGHRVRAARQGWSGNASEDYAPQLASHHSTQPNCAARSGACMGFPASAGAFARVLTHAERLLAQAAHECDGHHGDGVARQVAGRHGGRQAQDPAGTGGQGEGAEAVPNCLAQSAMMKLAVARTIAEQQSLESERWAAGGRQAGRNPRSTPGRRRRLGRPTVLPQRAADWALPAHPRPSIQAALQAAPRESRRAVQPLPPLVAPPPRLPPRLPPLSRLPLLPSRRMGGR